MRQTFQACRPAALNAMVQQKIVKQTAKTTNGNAKCPTRKGAATWHKVAGTNAAVLQKPEASMAKGATFGVAYARTSSFGKKVQGSRARQVEEASAAASQEGVKIHTAVAEVISGYLKYQQRHTLKDIVRRRFPGMPASKQKTIHAFVESVRALARNSMTAEEIYQDSVRNNIKIVPKDYPSLFDHQQTPTGNFVRKLICSLQELDRDTLVWRLEHGRNEKKKTTTQKNTMWASKSEWLQKLPGRTQAKPGCRGRSSSWVSSGPMDTLGGDLWRRRSALLKLKEALPHETVRRMHDDIAAQHGM